LNRNKTKCTKRIQAAALREQRTQQRGRLQGAWFSKKSNTGILQRRFIMLDPEFDRLKARVFASCEHLHISPIPTLPFLSLVSQPMSLAASISLHLYFCIFISPLYQTKANFNAHHMYVFCTRSAHVFCPRVLHLHLQVCSGG
jgi:hypothetical protein